MCLASGPYGGALAPSSGSGCAPVLKALRKNGLDVVGIHHYLTDDRPMIIFLHDWGTGPAEELATGFKAAVNELGKHGAPSS